MKNLQDFIQQHKADFETERPSQNNETRFLEKLNRQSTIAEVGNVSSVYRWFAIVASILVLSGFAAGIYFYVNQHENKPTAESISLPPDIAEMEQYYQVQNSGKLQKIAALSKQNPGSEDVSRMLQTEIDRISESSSKLKEDYRNGNTDDRVFDAIRNNYRIISELLNKVVEQLSSPDPNESVNTVKPSKNKAYEKSLV